MAVTYYKRFRMEIGLTQLGSGEPALPAGFAFVPWQTSLLERHAAAKYESFRAELDADIFPSLGELSGCRSLMSDIVQRVTFVPQATWLVQCRDRGLVEDCATIQGVIQPGRWGAIQNVGVAPEYRGLGLGRALVLRSLHGFREAGVSCVYLEVTARNTPAVALYRSIGFQLAKTSYKAVECPTAALAVM